MKYDGMMTYRLSDSWAIRFPDEWLSDATTHKNGTTEYVFWPADSDLTVRISVLSVSKFGMKAPVSVLQRSVSMTIPRSAKVDNPSKINIDGVHTTTYRNVCYENGEAVTELGVLCVVPGMILVAHVYGIRADECTDALRYFSSLQFCGYS